MPPPAGVAGLLCLGCCGAALRVSSEHAASCAGRHAGVVEGITQLSCIVPPCAGLLAGVPQLAGGGRHHATAGEGQACKLPTSSLGVSGRLGSTQAGRIKWP